MGIFYLAIILSGLLKTPFLALSLLIFLVPNEHFTSKRQNIISKLGILLTLCIGIAWSSYATSVLENSWRGDAFASNHVNAKEQMTYLISHPVFSLERLSDTISEFPVIVDRFFYFSNAAGQYFSSLMSILYMLFFTLFSLIYPLDEKFDLKTRIKVFAIGILIYLSEYLNLTPKTNI